MERDKIRIDASVINKLIRDEWNALTHISATAADEIALVAWASTFVSGLEPAQVLAIARGHASLLGSTTTEIKYVEHCEHRFYRGATESKQ
jgi:hypothetical protein